MNKLKILCKSRLTIDLCLIKGFFIFHFSFFIFHCNAQDLHFSQYYRTPLFLNPANTGAFEDDVRIMAIGRNQWQLIPVPYNSVGFSADMNFPMKVLRDKFGLGVQMLADRAGDSKFTTFQGTLSGSFQFITAGMNMMILAIGANANFTQRRYDPYALTFDNQFNGDYFDPGIPINEQFDRLSLSFVDFGLGVNYQQTFNYKHIINVGASLQHLGSSEQNFINVSTNTLLQHRINLYFNADLRLYKTFSIIPLFYTQHQDSKYEYVLGLGAGWHLQQENVERNRMKIGMSFRLNDAMIPWAQWDYRKSSFQLSYDANTSPLRIASKSYGGLEFSYGLTIKYRASRERMYDFCPFIWF